MSASRVQKGDVAVFLLSAKLVEAGLVVMKPLCEALPFDLVVYNNDKYYRIQVKRAQKYKGGPRYLITFRKTTVNSKGPKTYRYTAKHTDFIAGVVVATGDVYCFPIHDIIDIKAEIQVDPLHTSSKVSLNRILDPEVYRNVIKLDDTLVML